MEQEKKVLSLEQVLSELNPAEQQAAILMYKEDKSTPQEIKEFFDSL